MVATVKIIPYARRRRRAVGARRSRPPARRRARGCTASARGTASLILTRTPGLKQSLLAKGAEAVAGAARGARLDAWRPPVTVPHEAGGGGRGGRARRRATWC